MYNTSDININAQINKWSYKQCKWDRIIEIV